MLPVQPHARTEPGAVACAAPGEMSSPALSTASTQSRRSGLDLDKLISLSFCHLDCASALPRRATIRWERRPQPTILLPFKTEYKRGLPPPAHPVNLADNESISPVRRWAPRC